MNDTPQTRIMTRRVAGSVFCILEARTASGEWVDAFSSPIYDECWSRRTLVRYMGRDGIKVLEPGCWPPSNPIR